MNIRCYSEPDRESLLKLWFDIFGLGRSHNDPQWSLDMKLKQKDGLLFVAEENGNILGSVMGGFDGHRGWIYSLCVREDFRKQGIGRKLIDTVLGELKARGCRKVNLQVLGSNKSVLDFYANLGFEIEERISMGMVLL